MRRLIVAVVLVVLAIGGAAAYDDRKAPAALSFGIVPQQSATELATYWGPILNFLGAKTGLTLRFATAKDIPTFERRLAAGEYDLAYMNPYHYTVFHRSPGYRVLAKEQDRMLKGILVVRKDAAVADIRQLDGATVAFPGPAAFAATILPQAELRKLGIAIAPKYVASHDSVYLAVARGFALAGGGIPRTFENLPAETRDQLRVLWSTAAYTPHAIAAHPRLPAETAARLQAAMVEMAADPQGAELLKAIGFKGLITARDGDYDDIRHIDVRLLEPLIGR